MNRVSRLGSEKLHHASRAFSRTRRRPAEMRAANTIDVRPGAPAARDFFTGGYEPVEQILSDILRSAMDVTCAEQGFMLVSREGSVLEVAGARNIRPAEVMDVVLSRAATPVHTALREGRLAAADDSGRSLPIYDGFFETNAPAVLCVPLDLGMRQSGVLCLTRRPAARKLSELDLEIVQALAEQAALAIGAACNQSALTRLEASLCELTPAAA